MKNSEIIKYYQCMESGKKMSLECDDYTGTARVQFYSKNDLLGKLKACWSTLVDKHISFGRIDKNTASDLGKDLVNFSKRKIK